MYSKYCMYCIRLWLGLLVVVLANALDAFDMRGSNSTLFFSHE